MPANTPIIRPKRHQAWWRPGMLLLSLVIAFHPIAIGVVYSCLTKKDIIGVLTTPVSVVLAWLMLRMRGQWWWDVGLRLPHAAGRTIAVVIFGLALLLLTDWGFESATKATTGIQLDKSSVQALRRSPVVLLVLIALVSLYAASEELLFRGFLLNTLRALFGKVAGERWARVWAVALATSLFALAHLNQGAVIAAFTWIAGFLLTMIYLAGRRNLWTVILVNSIYQSVILFWIFMNWGP